MLWLVQTALGFPCRQYLPVLPASPRLCMSYLQCIVHAKLQQTVHATPTASYACPMTHATKEIGCCRHPSAMLCVLWLGSSVGNLKPHEAVSFFQSMQQSAGPNVQVSASFALSLDLSQTRKAALVHGMLYAVAWSKATVSLHNPNRAVLQGGLGLYTHSNWFGASCCLCHLPIWFLSC